MPPKIARLFDRAERSVLEGLLREGGAKQPARVVDAIEISALAAIHSLEYAKAHPGGGRGDVKRLLRIQSAGRLLRQALGPNFSSEHDLEDFDQWLRDAGQRRNRKVDWDCEFPTKLFQEALDDIISAANSTLNSMKSEDALDDTGRTRAQTIPKLTAEKILRDFIDETLVTYRAATNSLPTANDASRPIGSFSRFIAQAIGPVGKALGRSKKWPAMRSQINRRRKELLQVPRSGNR